MLSYNEPLKKSVDELFLLIENQDNDQDSGVFLTKLQEINQEKNIFDNFWYSNSSLKTKMSGMKEIFQQEQSFLSKLNRYTAADSENGKTEF